MAIEAKIIDEVIEKIEKNIDNRFDDVHEHKIKNKIEVENPCNSNIGSQCKKSNQSIATSNSTWIPRRKNIRIFLVALMFLCLCFTIKSGMKSSTNIPYKNNHANKNVTTSHGNILTTIISSIEVNFNKVNERIKGKYHHLQGWLYNDVQVKKPLIVSTSSNNLRDHENLQDSTHDLKKSNDGEQEWPNIEQTNEISLQDVSKIDHKDFGSRGDDSSHMSHEDLDNNDLIVKDIITIDGSKPKNEDGQVTVIMIENMKYDLKKSDDKLDDKFQISNAPQKIEVVNNAERLVNTSMNLVDARLDDYTRVESNNMKDSFDPINQGTVDEKVYNKKLDGNGDGNHSKGETKLYTKKDEDGDLIRKHIEDPNYYNGSIDNIDNHVPELDKNSVHLNNTFHAVHGYELEARNTKNHEETFSTDGLYDDLSSAKGQLKNVLDKNLEKPHEAFNSSTKDLHYDSVENNNTIVESNINNANKINDELTMKNVVNPKIITVDVKFNHENLENTHGSEEGVNEFVNLLPNEENVDKLHVQVDNVEQVQPLEYFDGVGNVVGKTSYYAAHSPQIQGNNNQLDIPNERIYDYIGFEPSTNNVESEIVSNDERNIKQSLEKPLNITTPRVDEIKIPQNTSLDNDRIVKELEIRENTKDTNIDIEFYKIEISKNLDDTRREDEIKESMD